METIIDYGMNGEGVAKQNGKVLLVNNALIDEEVELEIEKDYKNYAQAKIKKIIKASEYRQNPPCPYFEECGGCDLQHMKYNEQLKFKKILVEKTLKKIADIIADVNPTISCSKIFNYRNKVSFNHTNKSFGFYKNNSKDIVEISSCMLATEQINAIYQTIKYYLIDQNLSSFVKNIVIREIENQILIAVVTKKEINIVLLYDLLKKYCSNIGLFLVVNNRKDSVVLSGTTKHIAGIKDIKINNYNLNYKVEILGFHQTNIEIQNKIYEKVLSYIDKNSIVLNGFSGQGLLTAILSTKAKYVYGIEINKNSHLSAENLKTQNDIKNMTNILGDFNKELKKVITKVDTIVLDPSKKGCGKEIMKQIKGIPTIIYISCNPIALAKDLSILKEDYIIEEITPYDMFPQTKNVETLVKLTQKKDA